MEKYKFGIIAEKVSAQTATDFDVTGVNPYSSAYFDDPKHMSVCRDIGRITSIPSPYARMHITDLAFKEANCGSATMNRGLMQRRALSADYNRAMSHCLDIYELLFNADRINLQELGITLHKLDLVSTHSILPNIQALFQDQFGRPTRLKSYIQTLDLFRDEYVNTLRDIAQRNDVRGYSFDFTSLYILKYNGKTFASTSPFTGFYAKSDCDLSELGLEVDALGVAPGIYTARFGAMNGYGESHDSDANIRCLLDKIEGAETRAARFRTVIALVRGKGAEEGGQEGNLFEGIVEGRILRQRAGEGGFGYDPVFAPAEAGGLSFAQMSAEAKNAISHRGRATKAFAEFLASESNN